jgi:hypothetical protein
VGIVGNLAVSIARHIPDDETADHVFQGLHIFPPFEVDPTGSARNTKANPVRSKIFVITAQYRCQKTVLRI